MALSTAKVIPSEHHDVVLDVSYNYYGNRMATASADHTVCIWDIQEDGNWKRVASFTTHSGAVWKVNWAHPDFGQVIATCSFDKVVAIWEELPSEQLGVQNAGHTWAKRTQLVDAKTPVIDVRFAPKHLGLMLAAASTDGVLRVYEAADAPNVRHMSVVDSQQVSGRLSCLSWSTSMMLMPLLAAGMAEVNSGSTTNQYYVVLFLFAPEARRLFLLQSVLCPISEPVNDIDFAPSLGRSFHVLAVGGKTLTILNINPPSVSSGVDTSNSVTPSSGYTLDVRPAILRGANGRENVQVWCVSWNATGTILATSHDDGSVCLWKCDHLGEWQCVSGSVGDNSV